MADNLITAKYDQEQKQVFDPQQNPIAMLPVLSQVNPFTGGIGSHVGMRPVAGQFSPGIIRDIMLDSSWLRPTHTHLLDPVNHIGMTPLVSGLMTVSHDAAEGERGVGAIKVSVSASSDPASYTMRIPLPTPAETGVATKPLQAGPVVHYRVKCSDWSKVKRLYVGMTQDGGSSNYRLAVLSNLGASRFGNHDPAYAAAWNNKYRTLVMQSRDHVAVGAPASWGTGVSDKYFALDGIIVTLITTGAVDLWFERIYSVEWPIAICTPIIDGCYLSARQRFLADFTARGWGWGASANKVEDGGITPGYSDLSAAAAAGADVFAHGHYLSGGGPTGLTGSETEAQFLPILLAQRQRLANAGVSARGLQWQQFLQNKGNISGGDMAGALKKLGINAARAETSDAEFGVNPYNSTYTTPQVIQGAAAFVGKRGRFNRQYTMGCLGLPTGPEPYDYVASQTLRTEMQYAVDQGLAITPYFHQFIDAAVVNIDNTPAFYNGWLADMDAKVNAGKLLVLRPTDLERLTYWRTDDVFVRWDGEWVYRADPTKIAF